MLYNIYSVHCTHPVYTTNVGLCVSVLIVPYLYRLQNNNYASGVSYSTPPCRMNHKKQYNVRFRILVVYNRLPIQHT